MRVYINVSKKPGNPPFVRGEGDTLAEALDNLREWIVTYRHSYLDQHNRTIKEYEKTVKVSEQQWHRVRDETNPLLNEVSLEIQRRQ